MNDKIFDFLFSVLQITLIDIVLSGDNVGVIALAIRRLPEKHARTANIIGITGAVCMRMLFASLVSILISVEWLPIKLIGGILLLSITWDLVNVKESAAVANPHPQKNFWKAVYNIIMADITMSLDNVIAVGGVAKGSIELIIFGLLLNIPIIFWGTQVVIKLIKRYTITIYLGAGVFVHTALEMILEDRLIFHYTSNIFKAFFPWFVGILVVLLAILTKGDLRNRR